jgi:DNA primase
MLQSPAKWQELIDNALPLLDFVFDRVAALVDLSTARGKAEAAEKLLPEVQQIQDVVRRAHYVNKLAELTGVRPRELEFKLAEKRRETAIKKEAVTEKGKAKENITEDYFLALLLKHPETRASYSDLPMEYFEGTENREIFQAACRYELPEQIEATLDSSVWEHCRNLLEAKVISDQIELRLSDLALRLKEAFFKRLAQNKEDIIEPETADAIRQVFKDKEKLGIKRRKK